MRIEQVLSNKNEQFTSTQLHFDSNFASREELFLDVNIKS